MKDKEKEALDCAKKIKEFCGIISTEIGCNKCVFREKKCGYASCLLTDKCPEYWELDDIPKKKITDKQKQLLSLLDERWKYIARDKRGEIFVYEFKPCKYDFIFSINEGIFKKVSDIYTDDMFDYLYWEDKEATLIEDLIK